MTSLVERIREEGAVFLSSISLTGTGSGGDGAATDTTDEDDTRPQGQTSLDRLHDADESMERMTSSTSSSNVQRRRQRRLTSDDMERLKGMIRNAMAAPPSSPKVARHVPSLSIVSDVKSNADMLVNTRVLVTSPRGGMPLATFSLIPPKKERRRRADKAPSKKQGVCVCLCVFVFFFVCVCVFLCVCFCKCACSLEVGSLKDKVLPVCFADFWAVLVLLFRQVCGEEDAKDTEL